MTTTVQAVRVDTTLGSTRDGQRMLAVWWADLAMDYARHGAASNAGAAALNAAHFGRLAIENGGTA